MATQSQYSGSEALSRINRSTNPSTSGPFSQTASSIMQLTAQGSVKDCITTSGGGRVSNMTIGTGMSYTMFKQRCEVILKQGEKDSQDKAPSMSQSSGSSLSDDPSSSVDAAGIKSVASQTPREDTPKGERYLARKQTPSSSIEASGNRDVERDPNFSDRELQTDEGDKHEVNIFSQPQTP